MKFLSLALTFLLVQKTYQVKACTGTNLTFGKCTTGQCDDTTDSKCTATKCVSGYGLGGDTNAICRKCAHGLADCDAKFHEGTACLDGFWLDTNACKPCPGDNVKTCSASNGATIDSCEDGYSKISSKCEKCTNANTKTCTSKVGESTACMDGYFLDTTKKDCATACPSNATTCSDASTATACKAGYFKNSNACTACPSNATTCSDASTATACAAGYTVKSNACTKCSTTNTKNCKAGDETKAIECADTYKLDSDACAAQCTGDAKVCDATNLIECKDGYSLNGTTLTCQQCTAVNAAECGYDLAKAAKCLDEYELAKDAASCCGEHKNCKTCDAGSKDCKTCDTAWTVGTTSKACDTLNTSYSCSGSVCHATCKTCGSDHCKADKCVTCFFEEHVLVAARPASGTTFPSAGKCQKGPCPAAHISSVNPKGTTGQKGTSDAPEVCVPCSDANCTTCVSKTKGDVTDECSACKTGYKLESAKCVEDKKSTTEETSEESSTSSSYLAQFLLSVFGLLYLF